MELLVVIQISGRAVDALLKKIFFFFKKDKGMFVNKKSSAKSLAVCGMNTNWLTQYFPQYSSSLDHTPKPHPFQEPK